MATSKGKRKREVEAPRLPDDAWRRILGDLPADYPLHSVACVSKQLLRIAREMEGAAQTDLGPLLSMTSVTFSASFLDWLHLCVCGRDDLDEGVQEAVAILAARSPGGLDVLRRSGATLSQELAAAAAEGGQVETLQWLRGRGCPFDESVCATAAEHGRIEALEWLRSQDPPVPFNRWTTHAAALKGRVDTLEWLASKGCPYDSWMLRGAAREGHLGVLKWGRSRGLHWHDDVIPMASAGGHLELIKWASSQGCPMDYRACREAAENGKLEVLNWLKENGCPAFPGEEPEE